MSAISLKTKTYYVQQVGDEGVIPAFTPVSTFPGVDAIPVKIPDFAVYKPYFNDKPILLIDFDSSSISKQSSLKNGNLHEKVLLKSLEVVEYSNLNEISRHFIVEPGMITDHGEVINQIASGKISTVQDLNTGKISSVLTDIIVPIAKSINEMLDKINICESNKSQVEAIESEFDMFKSLSGESVSGGQRLNHKYIDRKPNPNYNGINGSKYLYLYRLPNGKMQWREDAPSHGEAGQASPRPGVEKAIHELSKKKEDARPDSIKGIKSGSQITHNGAHYLLKDQLSSGYILQDEHGKHHFKTNEMLSNGVSAIHHPDSNTVNIHGEDWKIEHSGRHNHVISNPKTGDVKFHPIVKDAKNYNDDGSEIDAPEMPKSGDNSNISKMLEGMKYEKSEKIDTQKDIYEKAEREFKAEKALDRKNSPEYQRSQANLKSHAERFGFEPTESGSYQKKLNLFGSETVLEIVNDKDGSPVTMVSGRPFELQHKNETTKRRIVSINPENMMITAEDLRIQYGDGPHRKQYEDVYKEFPITDAVEYGSGKLSFNEQTGGIEFTSGISSDKSPKKVNLEHLGDWTLPDYLTKPEASFLVSGAVFGAVNIGDHISFVRLGNIETEGVIVAKGDHVAGIFDKYGKAVLVNANDIHNIHDHTENTQEIADQIGKYHSFGKQYREDNKIYPEEIKSRYLTAEIGLQRKLDSLRNKLHATSDPFESESIKTQLASTENEYSTIREVRIRGEAAGSKGLSSDVLKYHEAIGKRKSLETEIKGHQYLENELQAHTNRLIEQYNGIKGQPGKQNEVKSIMASLRDSSFELSRATRSRETAEKKLQNIDRSLQSISSRNDGFIPSSLHSVEIPEDSHGEIFDKIHNPVNDLKGSDGTVLPQYTTPEKLNSVILSHLDAYNSESSPVRKTLIDNRIKDFISGNRVIKNLKSDHDYTHPFRPFDDHEIKNYPELSTLEQRVKDQEFGRDLFPVMLSEMRSQAHDLKGKGFTELEGIEKFYGIKPQKRDQQFTPTDIFSEFFKDENKNQKPEKPVQKPDDKIKRANIGLSAVHNPTNIARSNYNRFGAIINEHFKQNPETESNLKDANTHLREASKVADLLKSYDEKQSALSSQFVTENGERLPLHGLSDEEYTSAAHGIIQERAKHISEKDSTPEISVDSEQTSDPLSVSLNSSDSDRKYSNLAKVNPSTITVHRVDKNALKQGLQEAINSCKIPSSANPDIIISKLNIGDKSHQHSDYQDRDKTDTDRALQYALNWDGQKTEAKPIQYHSPDDGKSNHVFIGNHRTLGAQLYQAIFNQTPTLYGMKFNGHKDDAVRMGKFENLEGEGETTKEISRKVRELMSTGGMPNVKKTLGWGSKKNNEIYRFNNLGHLDPSGEFMGNYESPAYQELKHDFFAEKVGELRASYPQLTDNHEVEIYNHLFNNREQIALMLQKAKGKDGGKSSHSAIAEELAGQVVTRVSDPKFNPDSKLNLNIFSGIANRKQSDIKSENLSEEMQNEFEKNNAILNTDDDVLLANRMESKLNELKKTDAKKEKLTGDEQIAVHEEHNRYLKNIRERQAEIKRISMGKNENQDDMFGDMFKSLTVLGWFRKTFGY